MCAEASRASRHAQETLSSRAIAANSDNIVYAVECKIFLFLFKAIQMFRYNDIDIGWLSCMFAYCVAPPDSRHRVAHMVRHAKWFQCRRRRRLMRLRIEYATQLQIMTKCLARAHRPHYELSSDWVAFSRWVPVPIWCVRVISTKPTWALWYVSQFYRYSGDNLQCNNLTAKCSMSSATRLRLTANCSIKKPVWIFAIFA